MTQPLAAELARHYRADRLAQAEAARTSRLVLEDTTTPPEPVARQRMRLLLAVRRA